MRILHLNPYFFPYNGGIERIIWGTSKELLKKGHEMHVLTSQLPGTLAEEKVDGIHVRRLESKFYDLANYNPPFLSTKGLEEAIRDISPDVIDFYYRWAPDYTRSAKKVRKDIPVVFTFANTFGEGEGLEGRISYISDSIFKYFVRQCDLIICISEFIRHDLKSRKIAPEKLRMVYPGIDPTPDAELKRLRAAQGRPQGPYAVFTGRIVRTKGLNVLIETIRDIKAPLTFYLLGDGPEVQNLKDEARDFGVEGRVKFMGYTEESRKRELIAQADLMVHPATFESFGVILLEALDLGCPVVSTLVGGIPEVVGDAGVLVRPGDPEELARAVDGVMKDAPHRRKMSEAGRARTKQFTWPQ